MDASVFIVGLVALVLGGLIGWLFAGRQAAGARQAVESLRLQLDEVVKERDANRDAATRLAALEASQLEREKGFEARIKELEKPAEEGQDDKETAGLLGVGTIWWVLGGAVVLS